MKCTGANLSFLCVLASMMIGSGNSGSSSVRGSFAAVTLLLGSPSLDVCVSLFWGTRIVFFLVCPSLTFPPPRSSGHPNVIFGREVPGGCGEPRGWMGSGISPSDLSTRLPFDFLPHGVDDLLGIGDCGSVYVCV
jgi:hypothetical protein